jgi:glycerol kinase
MSWRRPFKAADAWVRFRAAPAAAGPMRDHRAMTAPAPTPSPRPPSLRSLAWRQALRDFRAGEQSLLAVAVMLAVAALTAVGFFADRLSNGLQRDARQPLLELRVDGGATANDLMMQFQADLLGVPVVRPKVTETTALGAAYLAGLAVGFWGSMDEVASNWQVDRRFEPALPRDAAEARLRTWERAVERSRAWHVEDGTMLRGPRS